MEPKRQPKTRADVLQASLMLLADRLPAGWKIRPFPPNGPAETHSDALWEVKAPDGTSAVLMVEVKLTMERRDLAFLQRQAVSPVKISERYGVVVSRYISPPMRKRLSEAGLSFVDATGNIRLNIPQPGLYIADQGADRDPWRGPGRPRGTLKGSPAAKVVRALLDYDRAWKIRELVGTAEVSTGSAYRVLQFLEKEELATRDDSGAVLVPDWVALLRRWSEDYGFVRDSHVTRWIAPRGLPSVMERAAGSPVDYAVTGTLAAANWAPYAPARAAMIYTADAERAAQLWQLRPADAGANVMLAEPGTDVVFARTLTTPAGITVASPPQVAVDLMTGPGRSPSEAEELIEWMTRNETSWRRQ